MLWLIDATAPVTDVPADLAAHERRVLRVVNKIDVHGAGDVVADHAISAREGTGVQVLVAKLAALAREAAHGVGDPAITQLRHRQQIEACLDALKDVRPSSKLPPEIAAEQLRIAAESLGRIVGRIDPEDVLDQVFARFCIGK